MMHVLKRAWAETLMPIFSTTRQAQVSALCYRETKEGRQILLITSRDTGRWIIPKGWPIEGLDAAGAAMQEAWEEAGVSKVGQTEAMGTFDYDKRLKNGGILPVRTEVFAAEVLEVRDTYPEAKQRHRAWFTPLEASELVDEPQLQDILRTF